MLLILMSHEIWMTSVFLLTYFCENVKIKHGTWKMKFMLYIYISLCVYQIMWALTIHWGAREHPHRKLGPLIEQKKNNSVKRTKNNSNETSWVRDF